LAETDPKLGDQLFDILTRIKAVDEEIARLGGAPDGSGGVPHAGGAGIAKELRLPGSGGSREWPPPRPPGLVHTFPFDRRYSVDW
jgi:hypothetical protein